MSENRLFEDYANFEFKESPPVLPVIKGKEIADDEQRMAAGVVTTAIEIDENTIIKLNRLLVTDVVAEGIVTRDTHAEDYLVPKEGSREEVEEKMRALAKDKKATYEKLSRYIGEFLPEQKGFAIVDSPRKQLEDSRLREKLKVAELPEHIMALLPDSELTLMEVWENVGIKEDISKKRMERLQQMIQDAEFNKQISDFAQGAFELFVEEGIMLDICDGKGIRVREKDDSKSEIKKLSDLEALAKSNIAERIPYPRNTVYHNGKLKFYDIYPIDQIQEPLGKNVLKGLADIVGGDNWDEIRNLVDTFGDENPEIMGMVRYLVLLKKMGANLNL